MVLSELALAYALRIKNHEAKILFNSNQRVIQFLHSPSARNVTFSINPMKVRCIGNKSIIKLCGFKQSKIFTNSLYNIF